jgi:large subunit ribosomal protein L19e
MSLKNQRRIAAQVLKCSPYRVKFDPERLSDIKEAITKLDIRGLIKEDAIKERPVTGIARGRARELALKKRRGQRRGHGSRKGKSTARLARKKNWINHIRSQRKLIMRLKEHEKIDRKVYRMLYRKSNGGFFRNMRHIKLYIEEHKLMKNDKT